MNLTENYWAIEENKLFFLVLNAYTKGSKDYSFKLRPTLNELSQCKIGMSGVSVNNFTISDALGNVK